MARIKRRKFLKGATTATSSAALVNPLRLLFGSLIQGMIEEARGSSHSDQVANYFFLQIDGGVYRHSFDNWLAGYSDSGQMFSNPSIATNYVQPISGQPDEYRQTEYRTVNYNIPSQAGGGVLRLPYLWNQNIPTADGGVAPMNSLLPHMLVVMGATMPSDGHPNNQIKTQLLDGAAFTPAGAILDQVFDSQLATLVPALGIGYGVSRRFKSRHNASIPALTPADPTTYAHTALDGFSDRDPETLLQGILNRRELMDAWVKAGLDALRMVTESVKGPSSGFPFQLRHTADETLRSGLRDVFDYYYSTGSGGNPSGALTKYRDLCQRAIAMRVPLINDRPVRSTRNGYDNVHGFIPSELVVWPDMADMIHGSPDIKVVHFPESFAMAEALFNTGYSKVILSYNSTFLENMMCGPTSNPRRCECDPHFSSVNTQILVDRAMTMSLASCMYEFRNAVERFDNTVFQFSTEMVRAPDSVATVGADGVPFRFLGNSAHGWQGNVGSFFTGKVVGPIAAGCVQQGVDPSNYSADPNAPNYVERFTPGTWGAAGTLPAQDAQAIGVNTLRIDHIISQACALLGVHSPAPNFRAPVQESSDGKFRSSGSIIGRYKIRP